MYVCICNRVTKKDVESAVENGVSTVNGLQRALNLGTNCGSCLSHAASVLNATKQATENPDMFYAA